MFQVNAVTRVAEAVLRLRVHAFRLQIAPSNFGPLEEGNAMSLSMYQASVPLFVAMLTNLTAILEKAEATFCSIGVSRRICFP